MRKINFRQPGTTACTRTESSRRPWFVVIPAKLRVVESRLIPQSIPWLDAQHILKDYSAICSTHSPSPRRFGAGRAVRLMSLQAARCREAFLALQLVASENESDKGERPGERPVDPAIAMIPRWAARCGVHDPKRRNRPPCISDAEHYIIRFGLATEVAMRGRIAGGENAGGLIPGTLDTAQITPHRCSDVTPHTCAPVFHLYLQARLPNGEHRRGK
jgi:hypothetical protein